MDSLPQELIDAIINNLPRSSLRSSSLVARRWRTTSQQRNFVSITFRSQDNVYHWLSNVQSGQNKIVPYIRSAQFRNISSWNKPTLFCRALQGFCSLTTLSVYRSMIPDELLGHISRGEFGRGITALYLEYPQCELSTIISMILSLPDLRKLVAKSGGTTSSQQPSTSSVAPCRGPFDLLGLYYGANGIAEALIQSRIASRYICLGAAISSVHQLLALSSESLKVLMLEGLWFLQVPQFRGNNNDLRRFPGQDTYPCHRSAIVSRPHLSTASPFWGEALASPYNHPVVGFFDPNVNLHRHPACAL